MSCICIHKHKAQAPTQSKTSHLFIVARHFGGSKWEIDFAYPEARIIRMEEKHLAGAFLHQQSSERKAKKKKRLYDAKTQTHILPKVRNEELALKVCITNFPDAEKAQSHTAETGKKTGLL